MTSSIGLVHLAVRRHQMGSGRVEGRSIHARHAPAGFGHNQRPCGHVPRLADAAPRSVEPSCRDVAQVERRGAKPSNGARLAEERPEQADEIAVCWCTS